MAQPLKISPPIFFKKIVQELKDHSDIEVIATPDLSRASESNFSSAKQMFGISYSPEIRSFFRAINGVQISWKYEHIFRGEINILDIGAITQGFYDDFWKNELKKLKTKEDKEFSLFCKNINALEIFDSTFDGTLRTVLQLQKNSPEPQSPPIWLWNLAGEKYPLSIDFTQYWPLLAKTRGFAGWPYFFIDLKKCRFKEAFFKKYFSRSVSDAIPFMKSFLKTMPLLFPNDDFSEFEGLYRKIEASL
jgi:hypothetical protein